MRRAVGSWGVAVAGSSSRRLPRHVLPRCMATTSWSSAVAEVVRLGTTRFKNRRPDRFVQWRERLVPAAVQDLGTGDPLLFLADHLLMAAPDQVCIIMLSPVVLCIVTALGQAKG
jgi:hypothetical protein